MASSARRQVASAWSLAPGGAVLAAAAAAAVGQQPPALRFALAQSSRQARRAPFASLRSSGGRRAAVPLFSLAALAAPASSSEAASSEPRGGTASGSGYESGSDEDSGDDSDLHLDEINCQLCSGPLSRPAARGGLFRRAARGGRGGTPRFLVCDCCQRCFHEACCKRKGVSTREAADGSWFHSAGCADCQARLDARVRGGPAPLPGGRSWQLIDCAPVAADGGAADSVRALQRLKRNLSDVLEVLLPSFGPTAAQQLVDTNKGFAVLLRQDQTPLTAGLLDVYGQDLAVLDLVATAMEEQGKGHCRCLLQALEGWLGPQLGVGSLVAVCPADVRASRAAGAGPGGARPRRPRAARWPPPAGRRPLPQERETIRVWEERLGFKRMSARQLRQLQSAVPPLNYYTDSLLLTKPLPKHQQGKQQQHAQAPPPEQAAS
ncbi:hypothetical protein HT031_000744 [Scenedesmus sp. PABB004]|nr:hypothetical protein HT031_000744 [Scenedesmus sp. PABB004]